MTHQVEIKVTADKLNDNNYIYSRLFQQLKLAKGQEIKYKLVRRSIDARKGRPKFVLRYLVSDTNEKIETPLESCQLDYKKNITNKKVLIIGAGPAGYFAALTCLERGLQPIVLERGKDVRKRRRDLKAIQQDGVVDPNSNYCFGEGGAGTYSDGKLYTRATKRGKILKVLKILIDHGANPEIGVDAHPHIGSNKLPGIIGNIRATIESYGGQVLFEHKVTDFIIKDGSCIGVVVNENEEHFADSIILATGHSARDIYKLLHQKEIRIEAKPFALGIRIEHPQSLIDEIQYAQNPRELDLPAASYRLTSQVDKIGVYSFCMCPGGLIVPSATQPGEIVVNGMSLSKRDSPYSNSGIVTSVSSEELNKRGFSGPLANMEFQSKVEQDLFEHGDGSQKAPAQNLIDFVNGNQMLNLNSSSYIPGLYQAPLHEWLPDFIYERLKKGLVDFSLKMKGFFTDQANVVAIESRTSAPIRIPRDKEHFQHPELKNLYPCGEGAGYAGGILSAAMDGQRVVKQMCENLGL